MACYAGHHLDPAEGFDQGFFILRAKQELILKFWSIKTTFLFIIKVSNFGKSTFYQIGELLLTKTINLW